MRICRAMKRGIHLLAHLFEYIGWFILLGWVALMTIGTIARYVFRSPLLFQIDLVSVALVVFATFCFGPVFLQGEHIRVDLFTRHLPNTVQQVLWLISESLFLVFTVLIIYSSFDLISHSIEVNSRLEVSEIPLTPFLLCLPVGLGFLGLVLLVDLCDRLYALFTGVRS